MSEGMHERTTLGLLLCWLTCKSSSFVKLSANVPADFHYSSFVHIFINSFSVGLTFELTNTNASTAASPTLRATLLDSLQIRRKGK
jgi:hypothetical protein